MELHEPIRASVSDACASTCIRETYCCGTAKFHAEDSDVVLVDFVEDDQTFMNDEERIYTWKF